jgi:hypothetical protein
MCKRRTGEMSTIMRKSLLVCLVTLAVFCVSALTLTKVEALEPARDFLHAGPSAGGHDIKVNFTVPLRVAFHADMY